MLSEGGAYVVPFLWGMGLLFLDWVAIYTLFEDRGAPLVVGDGGEEKGVLGELGLLLCARERRSFFGSYLCFTVGWNAYLLFIPVLWMERFSFTAGQIGGMYSYGALWFLASSGLLIHPLLRRFSSPRLLHWSLIASGLCFLPLLFFSSATLYWPLFPLQFFFYALFMAASYAHASNQVGEREQGAMMGVMQAIVSLGVVIATLLAAPLVGWNVQMALVLGLVGSILAAGLYRTT
jgi:MFS family permease